MSRLFIRIISLGIFVLFLSACSSLAEDSDPDARTINVAVPQSARPLSYTGTDGEMTGYEVEILKEADRRLEDYEFNIQGSDDAAAEIGLDTGQYDLIAQGLILSPEREASYIVPSESNGPSLMRIYATAGLEDEVNSLEDLQGRSIVPVSPSGGVFNMLSNYNEAHPDHALEFDTSGAGVPTSSRLQEVESGAYDALIQPSNLGQQDIIDAADLDLHVTEPIQIDPTYFLIHDAPENEELSRQISEVLKDMKEEGLMSELSEEFYGEDVMEYEDQVEE